MEWAAAIAGIVVGNGILAALAIALIAWRRRRRLEQAITAHACPACGSRFDESIAEYLGGVRAADRARLDRFQQRFAAHRFQCGDCGALITTTAAGEPFAARYERDDG